MQWDDLWVSLLASLYRQQNMLSFIAVFNGLTTRAISLQNFTKPGEVRTVWSLIHTDLLTYSMSHAFNMLLCQDIMRMFYWIKMLKMVRDCRGQPYCKHNHTSPSLPMKYRWPLVVPLASELCCENRQTQIFDLSLYSTHFITLASQKEETHT